MFHSNHVFCFSALAQRVQPGQGFHRPPAHGGPQRQDDGPSGPEAPVGGQHGSLLLHEEPAPFHLTEPSQEGFLPLPEHQVSSVHPLQPLHQIQQIAARAGAGAARAQPALPAAVHGLSLSLWKGKFKRRTPAQVCPALQVCTHSVRNSQVPPSLPPCRRCPPHPVRRKGNLVVAVPACEGLVPETGESLWAQSLKELRSHMGRRALSVAQELGCS